MKTIFLAYVKAIPHNRLNASFDDKVFGRLK